MMFSPWFRPQCERLQRAVARRVRGCGWLLVMGVLVLPLCADDAKLSELLKQGDAHDQQRETHEALKVFFEADALSPNNPEVLYRLAKQHADLIFDAKDTADKKTLAAGCLAFAQRAAAAGTNHAKAQLMLAICYAKNFPYADNQTKVSYSRLLKSATEQAIALDPKLDIAYHMLGRWHYEVANMNFMLRTIAKTAYGGLPPASNEEAVANFLKAVALDPERALHRLQLAKTYLEMNQKKLAIAELQTCIALKPKDKDDEAAQKFARERLKKLGVKLEPK